MNEREIFVNALKREAADREAFLAQACGGDSALRKQVEALPAEHAAISWHTPCANFARDNKVWRNPPRPNGRYSRERSNCLRKIAPRFSTAFHARRLDTPARADLGNFTSFSTVRSAGVALREGWSIKAVTGPCDSAANAAYRWGRAACRGPDRGSRSAIGDPRQRTVPADRSRIGEGSGLAPDNHASVHVQAVLRALSRTPHAMTSPLACIADRWSLAS